MLSNAQSDDTIMSKRWNLFYFKKQVTIVIIKWDILTAKKRFAKLKSSEENSPPKMFLLPSSHLGKSIPLFAL